MKFTAHDPLSGEALKSATLRPEEGLTLPAGPGALVILGRIVTKAGKENDG